MINMIFSLAQTSIPQARYIDQFMQKDRYQVSQQPISVSEQKDLSDSLQDVLTTQSKDLTDLFVDDRLKLARANLKLLQHQIDSRTKIRDNNIDSLDYTILRCGSYLAQMDDFPELANPLVESKRAALSTTVTKLESEKHTEMIKWWGDLTRVYSNLMDAVAEYMSLMRRKQILGGRYV